MNEMFRYSPGADAGDDLAPGDFRIDDRLATASPVIDHHDEILHQTILPRSDHRGVAGYF
jgi:hypothetical protein